MRTTLKHTWFWNIWRGSSAFSYFWARHLSRRNSDSTRYRTLPICEIINIWNYTLLHWEKIQLIGHIGTSQSFSLSGRGSGQLLPGRKRPRWSVETHLTDLFDFACWFSVEHVFDWNIFKYFILISIAVFRSWEHMDHSPTCQNGAQFRPHLRLVFGFLSVQKLTL